MMLSLRRCAAFAGFLACFALAVACLWAAAADPQWGALRIAAFALGFAVASRSLGDGLLLVLATAPFSAGVGRLWMVSQTSLTEHLLCGLLPVAAFDVWRSRELGAPSRVQAAALALLGLIALSLLRIVVDYQTQGIALASLFQDALPHHFEFLIGDVTIDRRGVVHEALLAAECLAFFVLLTWRGAAVDRRRLAAVVTGSGAAVAILALHQAWTGWGDATFRRHVQPELQRLTSTLADPNTFGVYLILVAPVGLAWLLSAPRRGRTGAAAAWTAMMSICLVATVSRSAWSGAVAGAVLLAVVAWRRPLLLGLRPGGRVPRAAGLATVALPASLLAAMTAITLFDLGRDISYRHASRPIDMVLVTLNLRRPRPELLPARVEHWQAAIALWRDAPLLGIGIGRYRLAKLAPPGNVVDRGEGGGTKGINTPGPGGKFELWINGAAGTDFAAADVLSGDTIESRGGGWGPIPITGRFSPTQLIVERAPPRAGKGLDYVIRHPTIDYRNPHAHNAMARNLPAFTTPHNNFLLLLSELGALGLALFLALLASLVAEAASVLIRGPGKEAALVLGASIGLLGTLVAAAAQDPLDNFAFACVFWAVAAMLALAEAGLSARENQGSRARPEPAAPCA